jgi:hypothetical protein
MAKTKLLTVPFFIIAYNQKTIFSIEDENGNNILPIFTNAVLAEKYRKYFARKYKLKLQVCIADKPENCLNLIECAMLACKALKFAVIDPPLPTTTSKQPVLKPIQSILTFLLGQYQKVRNRQNLHKK